jgi:hypothetical protein
MKRSSNRSNISIVRDYYDGNRPFTQIGYDPRLEDSNRNDGDEWEDSSGTRWKKENGYRKRISKHSKIIIEKRCKNCNKDTRWGNYLDDRVWGKSGLCYNCHVDRETKMKIAGIYEDFDRLRDLRNIKSYLLDTKQKLEEARDFCKKHQGEDVQFMEEDGSIEKWEGIEDYTSILKNIELDLKTLNSRLESIDDEISEKTDIVEKFIKK